MKEKRLQVVGEARTWIGTPYRHMARVKGHGADCAMLLAEVYERAGVIPHVETVYYPPDWHFHKSAERLLEIITQHAVEIPGPPRPGDIATFHFGKTYSHAAIVVEWPLCIHAAMSERATVYVDVSVDPQLQRCRQKFFSHWGGDNA